MSDLATAVVIHEDGQRILLHQREDFRIWGLPGGTIEEGETPEQAAIRETFEETGYYIEIDKFVGKYHRLQLKDVRFVFRGRVVGGVAIERGPETWQVGWFLSDELPKTLSPSTSEIIDDAVNAGQEPISKDLQYPIWQILVGRSLIWLRDLRNRFRDRF